MKSKNLLLVISVIAIMCTGCVTSKIDITGSTPLINLDLNDLEVTEQVEATAVSTKVFGIDWERLVASNEASIKGSVYSGLLNFDNTEYYAVYNLLKKNPGYDIVLYPQFHKVTRKPVLGMGAIYMVTEVKVTARMAKLKTK